MNVLRKTISIAVLLAAGMAGTAGLAYAAPDRDQRDAARIERKDLFRSREPQQPDAGRQSNADSGADRRQGRMSPEDRRALRRQINEAGHDIYVPRR